MPELIKKNVTIYRIPSKDFDTSNGFSAFLSTKSGIYILGILLKEDPEAKKVFERLSEGSVFLDQLYSISDTQISDHDIPQVKEKLPESYKVVPITEEEFEERYRKSRDKFEKSEKKSKDLEIFQEEMGSLRKLKKGYSLTQNDMIYIFQLTEKGWVNYHEPTAPGIVGLKKLRTWARLGLIQFKTMEDDRFPYYVRLTKEGASLQKKLRQMMIPPDLFYEGT